MCVIYVHPLIVDPISNPRLDSASAEDRVLYVIFDQMVYPTMEEPRKMMIEKGYAVTFAATSKKPVEGMLAPTGIFVCWPFGIWYNRYTSELTFDVWMVGHHQKVI
jgi:hypothetical protein